MQRQGNIAPLVPLLVLLPLAALASSVPDQTVHIVTSCVTRTKQAANVLESGASDTEKRKIGELIYLCVAKKVANEFGGPGYDALELNLVDSCPSPFTIIHAQGHALGALYAPEAAEHAFKKCLIHRSLEYIVYSQHHH